MQTPNTPAGQTTERIMSKVRQKLPELPTHEYNRMYEACLEVLSAMQDETVYDSGRDEYGFPKDFDIGDFNRLWKSKNK